jgi:hypothetical protein
MILWKDRADFPGINGVCGDMMPVKHPDNRKRTAMRLVIEIAAAALLVMCISVTSAAFAAGKAGRGADGLSCAFSVPQNASAGSRCTAIKKQCGGKFYANYCGDKLLSAM